MKLIFVVALALAVGASPQLRTRNNNNNNRNNNNNNNMNDTMNNMNKTMNDSMGGSMGASMGGSMGGECDMHGHHGGMFDSKMMFEEFTKICVDVRFPDELYEQCKQCMKEESKKSPMIDNLLKGTFPAKTELAKFMESLDLCKLKAGGINNIEKDLTNDKLMKALKYDMWTGNQQAKEQLKKEMTNCFNKAQGSGYQKMTDSQKCVTEYLLNECSRKGEDPGMLLVMSSKLLTIKDESKCAPVKVPEDTKQIRDRCLQQAKTSMSKMPESSTQSSDMDDSRKQMKAMKLAKHFMKEYMMKGVECFLTELKMFNTEMKTIDINGMSEYVKKMEGWNGIEKERDQVISGITECGKIFEEDDMMDSNEDDMNKMNNMNNPDEKKMKEMMKKKMEFEKCFSPKFAKICGINNQLADFFYPMLDPEFMGLIYKAFMETGGKEAEDVMAMLKEKLKQ